VYDALDDSRVLRVRGVKNVEDNQTVITGLKPKTKYAIRVRARNRAGSSNFTDDVFVRTRGEKIGLYLVRGRCYNTFFVRNLQIFAIS
jgi:hypothetical protein